jgi:hypothetical protein
MGIAKLTAVLTVVLGLFVAAPGTALIIDDPDPGGGSCWNACGGSSGNCWCDEACHTAGDCCPDKCAYCSSSACAPAAFNGAAFVSQSVSNPMSSGGTVRVTVEMQNTGTTTWRAHSEYNLGSQNPQDNGVWGLGRVGLDSDVPPGATYTFSFDVRAPTVTQNQARAFQWRMVQDGVEWFGAFTPNINVIVQPWTQPPADTLSNSFICPGFPDRCVGMCGDGCNGINLGSQGGLVQKWTCECLKHDLVPAWCSSPGPFRPGCQDTFLFNPGIATASCLNPDPNGVCDAERSFALKPDLGEGGLAQCDLTRNHIGNPATYLSPLEYCSTTGPFVLLPLRPPVAAPGPGEIWLGSTTLITDTKNPVFLPPNPLVFVRSHPRFGLYDSQVDGTLMTFSGTGRAVIGIAGKASRMYIFRVGPDSLLCTDPHFTPEGGCGGLVYDGNNLCGKKVCGSADGLPTEEALEHLYFHHNFDASGIKQVPFRHTVGGGSGDPFCGDSGTIGHSFKWCFVNNIAPGTYLGAATSRVKAFGLVEGHMTADTYWFGPAPAGCTPSCAGKPCGSDNGCGTGTCCNGSGCTVAACGTCKQPNACGSGCTNSPGGTGCSTPGGQPGTCDGGGTCIETPGGTCAGMCGVFAGTCWCDDSCESMGDCCPDKCGYCGCGGGGGDPCGGLPCPLP